MHIEIKPPAQVRGLIFIFEIRNIVEKSGIFGIGRPQVT